MSFFGSNLKIQFRDRGVVLTRRNFHKNRWTCGWSKNTERYKL